VLQVSINVSLGAFMLLERVQLARSDAIGLDGALFRKEGAHVGQ
jgi:hypothetical protein